MSTAFLPPSRCLLLAGALALTGGCQSLNRSERVVYVERPVEQLYNDAAKALDRKGLTEAVQLFDEVERQHPYSEWASRATLMSAFANYQANRYEEAISASRRYIALHPGNDETAYAYYLIAISHFEQIVDVGRDQRTTELAGQALLEVVRRYPETEYARDARLKLDMVQDQLAGKEMEIGRWYLRRNQHLAAINRFRNVIETYETTSHAEEALHRLVEAYLSIGLEDQALAAASVLGYNYPSSDWYASSYSLMTTRGIAPETAPEGEADGWLSNMWNRVF